MVVVVPQTAAHHGHDSVVLGAFGCGAFANPPKHMAEIFLRVRLPVAVAPCATAHRSTSRSLRISWACSRWLCSPS